MSTEDAKQAWADELIDRVNWLDDALNTERALADDLAAPLAWVADFLTEQMPADVLAAANAALARYREARQP